MGLWGSKQQKDITIKNPEPEGVVNVTPNAIDNIIRTQEQAERKAKGQSEPASKSQESQSTPSENYADLRLQADLQDKRIADYERNLLANFEQATKEVENLFRDRYQTVPVCMDEQKSVSECYTEYRGQPLKCLDIANKFIQCVEKERQSRFGLAPAQV